MRRHIVSLICELALPRRPQILSVPIHIYKNVLHIICVYICMYKHMHTHICMYIYTNVHLFTYTILYADCKPPGKTPSF